MKKLALLVLCVLVVPVVASGDLVIKERTSTSGFMGMGASEGVEITYIKGDKLRTETEATYSGMPPGMAPGMMPEETSTMVMIMRLDKGVMWHLDQDAKTYTEMSLTAEEIGEIGEAEEDLHFKVKDVKVTKSGDKKEIAGYKCEGIDIEMTFEVTSDEGVIPEPTEIRFWMASDEKELEEIRKVWERMVESVGGDREGFPMKAAMEELSKTMKDIKGTPLGMDMVLTLAMGGPPGEDEEMEEAMRMMKQFMKDTGAEEEGEGPPPNQFRITREAVSISQEKLDDSLFEIPEGYKKASEVRTW